MAVSDLAYIDSTGYHYADFPSFLAFVQSGYQAIYGTDIYLGADSQDGQWTTFLAQALYDTAALGASAYNSFSPATAQGVGLSKAVKLNGLEREVPTNSTVNLTIVGVANTTITNGIAVDTLNQQWALPASVTIPSGGSITVTATATVQGALNAAANTVTGIFTPTLGWQTVNNSSAATPGAPVESDGALRARQAVSTANPSVTVLEGTYGAVANTTGVEYTAVWENATNMVDGNGQPAHSIFVVVDGGTIPDVAAAIQIHKTPGTYPWGGPTYTFTVSSANATAGAVYTNNGGSFTVQTTISGGTSLLTTGLLAVPGSSGTLTKSSGTGDATITFSSVVNSGGNSQSQVVFDSRGQPITIGFFQPPIIAEIQVQLAITAGTVSSTVFQPIIASQVAAYINSLGIGCGQQTGGNITIYQILPNAYIPNYTPSQYTVTGIQIGVNGGSVSTSAIPISYIQLPYCNAATDVTT